MLTLYKKSNNKKSINKNRCIMLINNYNNRIVNYDGKKEPKKAFAYFQEYLSMGHSRTLSKVAERVGKSDKYITVLSSRWNWTEKANAYDLHLMEEPKREFEEETRERYYLANKLGLKSLKYFDDILDNNPSVKAVKAAGDMAAKLIKKESAVELDTNNGRVTNLSGEELLNNEKIL